MQLVISDPKTRNAYSKKIEESKQFNGKKIGETIKLDSAGLEGYEAKITGGSDKTGTPMRFDLLGIQRKKIYSGKGIGFRGKEKGLKVKKAVRGNTVGDDISQLNLAITKYGSKGLEEYFPKAEKKEEAPQESLKDKMIKESFEAAQNMTSEEAAKIKGKIKHA